MKELGLSGPVKKQIGGDTGAACNYWKGSHEECRAKLFSAVAASTTRGNKAMATGASLGSSSPAFQLWIKNRISSFKNLIYVPGHSLIH